MGFVTSHFGSTNLKHYFDHLKDASKQELKEFKKQVIFHSKTNHQHDAFLDVPNLSSHKAIILAINYELLKRSWRYKIFKIVFPVRQWLVKILKGINLTKHDIFGYLYIPQKHRSSVWHISHANLLTMFMSFWRNNWSNLLLAISAIGVLIVSILTYLGNQ